MKTSSVGTQPRRVKAAFIPPFAIVLISVLGAFVATAYDLQVPDRALGERVAAVGKLVDQTLGKAPT